MPDSIDRYPSISLVELGNLPPASSLILTVNNRLARRLTLDLATLRRQTQQVSELPRILPLSAWLADAAQALTFIDATPLPRYRLDSFATQLLWTETIRDEEADRVLLDTSQAARLAMDADLLMDEWALVVPASAETDEFTGFSRWRKRYRSRLVALDAEDSNTGYSSVLAAAQAGLLPMPEHIVLAGFSELSPRLRVLLRSFEQHGAQLHQWQESLEQPAALSRYCAPDAGSEWRAAAAWAGERLTRHPEGRYAIVSTRLEEEAPFARRVLAQALAMRTQQSPLAFNVAVGRELAQWPAARSALVWLDALAAMHTDGGAAVATLGAALLAGHCAGDPSEAGARAAVDASWRRQGAVRMNADAWARALRHCPMLLHAWSSAFDALSAGPARTTCDNWGPRLRAALSALGFPGDRAHDSTAFQTISAFSDLLDRFAALAPAAGSLDARQAVRLLEQLTRASPFQPQRDPSARLDVLGLLEAEGGRWDGVWILGLTDDVLPASPKPNPLLPLAVLRHAGTPRATPERERLWAQGMLESLCHCAPEIIASHAMQEGERELRPSPLIARVALLVGHPADRVAASPASTLLANTAEQPSSVQLDLLDDSALLTALETIEDHQGPPLREAAVTRGGLDVLDTQARNPQWAFVRHRLGARALAPYADLATVNARGQFLHKALELVWRMLPDQEALHASMAEKRLPALLAEAIGSAAETELAAYPHALRTLECDRAKEVLSAWLDVEAQRIPFAVARVEETLQWQRGALSLKVRLDRMDRLADGPALIIDYKTGGSTPKPESDWSRARPINLQLPFYASVLSENDPDETIAALVLAQIHARRISAHGLSDVDVGIEGVSDAAKSDAFAGMTWDDILAQWRDAIYLLAEEYAAGWAANTVVRADDLKFCDALPFLRLDLDEDDL
jgi:probable DNA repair protein